MVAVGLFILFGIVVLNLAAAGMFAVLTIRMVGVNRGRRIIWTIGMAGGLTALMFLGFALEDGPGEAWASAAILAIILAGGAILSLPGAVIMGRVMPDARAISLDDTFA